MWQHWKGEYVHGLMESHHIKRGTRNYPEVGEVVLIVREKKEQGSERRVSFLDTLEVSTTW